MAKIYSGEDFRKLSDTLSHEAMICLGYCHDCEDDGDCCLQDKVKEILGD